MSDDPRPPEERFDFTSLERLSANAPPPREPANWTPRILGMLAFLVVAAGVAAVPWYFLTRSGGTQATPAPSAVPRTQTPSPSPSPSPAFPAGTYEVVTTEGCLRVHSEPGVSGPVIDCLQSGVRMKSDGQTEQLGEFLWLHITDPFGRGEGWVATDYVKRAG